MPFDVMSGDETDHSRGKVRYVVRTPEWRHPNLSKWLMTFDFLHLSTRFNGDNRAKRGKFPHPRIRNTRRPALQGQAPPGLPANFYDEGYLKAMEPLEREILEVSMLPALDLEFSPFITRSVLLTRFPLHLLE
jgi:hypothetical protein